MYRKQSPCPTVRWTAPVGRRPQTFKPSGASSLSLARRRQNTCLRRRFQHRHAWHTGPPRLNLWQSLPTGPAAAAHHGPAAWPGHGPPPLQGHAKTPPPQGGRLGADDGGARACKRHTFRASRTAKMRPCSAPIFLSLRPHGINHAPPARPHGQRSGKRRHGRGLRRDPRPPPPPRPWGPPAPCSARKRPAHGVGSYAMWRGEGCDHPAPIPKGLLATRLAAARCLLCRCRS